MVEMKVEVFKKNGKFEIIYLAYQIRTQVVFPMPPVPSPCLPIVLTILLLRMLGWRQRLCQPLSLCLHDQHSCPSGYSGYLCLPPSEASGPYTLDTWTHESSKHKR